MTHDLARYLELMATYGAAGEARALDRLGIVRPAGALDVGKGAFAMLGPEVAAKLAAVKTALPPVPGKATAPTVADVSSTLPPDVAERAMFPLIRELLAPPTEAMLAEARGGMPMAEVMVRAASERGYATRPLSFRRRDRRPPVGIGVETTEFARISARWREIENSGIVRLLSYPASRAEIDRINHDIDLRVMPDVWRNYTTPVPHEEGWWPSLSTCVIDLFRVMQAMNFDAPMRVLGATNLYGWWMRRGLALALLDNPGTSFGFNGVVRLDVSNLRSWPSFGHARDHVWYPAIYALRLIERLWVLVHEARHASTNLLHNCNKVGSFYYNESLRAGLVGVGARILNLQDSSEAYGGAFSVSKAFCESTAFHSGAFLPQFIKELMRDRFHGADAEYFCDRPLGGGIGGLQHGTVPTRDLLAMIDGYQ